MSLAAFKAGFFPAVIGNTRAAQQSKALRITPGGAGTGDGSSWANAAPLTGINGLIPQARAAGAEIWVRADAGAYVLTQSQIIISEGGTDAAPVVIRGVDVNGKDKRAEIRGNRAAPWSAGATYGQYGFWLNTGADNLTFMFLDGRNIGAGLWRVRQPLRNLTITDCDGYNVGRFFDNVGVTSGTDATITTATFKRINVYGHSKTGFRVQYKSTNILFEDIFTDGQSKDGDRIAVGIQLNGTASYITVRRHRGINIYNAGPGTYWNGDGLSGERGNHHILIEDCYYAHITDGGVDCKAHHLVIRRTTTEDCKRGLRLWANPVDVEDCVGINPFKRGGSGSTWHVGAMQNGDSRVRVKGGSWRQTGASAPFRVFDNGLLVVDAAAQAAVVKPSSTAMFATEGVDDMQIGTWDHDDHTPPVILSSTIFQANENTPLKLFVQVDKFSTLEFQGPDAALLNNSGRYILVGRQDFENPKTADGSNTIKAQIRVRDVNDNVSPWQDLQITILDVADDPITPGEAFAYSGSRGGWWDVSDLSTLYQDVNMTVPAVVGGRVAVIADKSGKGNHWRQDDEDAQGILRNIGGVYSIAFDGGSTFYRGVNRGAFNFGQFTAIMVISRDRDDDGVSYILFFGRRNGTPSGTNGAFWLGVRDTASVFYRTNATNGTSPGVGALKNRPHAISYRSTDGSLRSDSVQIYDGDDVGTNTYPFIDYPILGARTFGETYDATNPSGYMFADWYGAAVFNKGLPDDTRARVERQLGTSAGLDL